MNGRERQTAVYVPGIAGRRPRVPVSFAALEREARAVMTDEAYAYVAAGAGAETTMAANRAAFERWRIVPRMLRDASERHLEVELFGRRLPAPLLIGPVGVLELADPEADLAVARAAAAAGVPMVFSNQASRPMEECAATMGDAPRWFQLYWSTSNDLVESLVARAERCGCEAIVVTLDTTLLGWRPRDLDEAYLPFLRGKGIAQYTSDPVFTRMLDERSRQAGDEEDRDGDASPQPPIRPATLRALVELTRAYPDRFLRALGSGRARSAVERFVQIYSRPSLTWEDLPFLRERTRLPILLKGILHPDDARRALDLGMDGIVVSNHGGRQVDGAIATLDALPAIVEVVGDRVPVLLDSGIRGGADILKALALGARAVLIGRPYVYALAVGGEQGVREVIENMVAELDLTLGLTGGSSVDGIGPETLTRVE